MRHPSRRQILGLSLALSTLPALAAGKTTATGSPDRPHPVRSGLRATTMLGLRPGDRLSLDGVSLLVPRPGAGSWGAAIEVGGRHRVVGIQTGLDGSVTVFRQVVLVARGAGGKAGPVTPAAKPMSACSDGTYSLTGASWHSRYNWYFKRSSTPTEISRSAAVSALRGAVNNLTHAHNDCGLPDRVSATAHYKGTTSRSANISTVSTCGRPDGTNVVDFGNLASIHLGYACWWTWGRSTVESDMRLNSREYSWAVALRGCVNKYSVEDVATHELGHTFGLTDLKESLHPSLTMSLIMLPCQKAETTLGLGDVKGLEAIY